MKYDSLVERLNSITSSRKLGISNVTESPWKIIEESAIVIEQLQLELESIKQRSKYFEDLTESIVSPIGQPMASKIYYSPVV
jgi:hypothetical protein